MALQRYGDREYYDGLWEYYESTVHKAHTTITTPANEMGKKKGEKKRQNTEKRPKIVKNANRSFI